LAASIKTHAVEKEFTHRYRIGKVSSIDINLLCDLPEVARCDNAEKSSAWKNQSY